MTPNKRFLVGSIVAATASVTYLAGCLPTPPLGAVVAPGSTNAPAVMVSGIAKVGSVPLANARIYVHDPLTDAPPLAPGSANVARLEFAATAFKTDGSGAFRIPLAVKPGQVAYVYISDGKQALGAFVASGMTTYRSTGKVPISDANPLLVDVDSTLQVRALAKPLEILGRGVPLFLIKGNFQERVQLLAKTIDVMAASAAEATRATLGSFADNAAAAALAERMTHADPVMLAGLKASVSQKAPSAFATKGFRTLGTYDTDLQELYVAYFGRPADPVGLTYWNNIIDRGVAAGQDRGSLLDSVRDSFGASAEYQATFTGLTSVQKIARIYNNLFSHDPDPTGLVYWANRLESGELTIGQIAKVIADAARTDATNVDGIAFNSKVTAAGLFTSALDTTDEIIGYSGAAAGELAKAFIARITSAATLATESAPAALSATVTTVTDGGKVVAPRTFTLTNGIDDIAEFDPINKKAPCTLIATTPGAVSAFDSWPARCVLNYGPPEPFALGEAEKKILEEGVLYLDNNGGTSLGDAVRRETGGTTGDSVGEKTIFNGKVFDDTNAPLDGVKVTAKSLDPAVSYAAETTTAGGGYAFNNAPAGVQIEITATKSGFTTRRTVEVLKPNKAGDPSINRYDFGSDGTPTSFQRQPGLSEAVTNLTVPLSGADAVPDPSTGVVKLTLNALYNAGVFRQKLADWLPETTRSRLSHVATLLKDGRTTWVRDLSYTAIDKAFRDDGVSITTAFVPGVPTAGASIDYTVALPNQLLRTVTRAGTTMFDGFDTYGFGSMPTIPFQVGSRSEVLNSDKTVAWYTFKLNQPTYKSGKPVGSEMVIADAMINGLTDRYDMQLPWPTDAVYQAAFPGPGQAFTGWVERRYTLNGAVILTMVSQKLTLAQGGLETTRTQAAASGGGPGGMAPN